MALKDSRLTAGDQDSLEIDPSLVPCWSIRSATKHHCPRVSTQQSRSTRMISTCGTRSKSHVRWWSIPKLWLQITNQHLAASCQSQGCHCGSIVAILSGDRACSTSLDNPLSTCTTLLEISRGGAELCMRLLIICIVFFRTCDWAGTFWLLTSVRSSPRYR